MKAYDGLLICSGPTLDEDMKLAPKGVSTVAVNTAINRICVQGEVKLISLDWPKYLIEMVRNHPGRDNILCLVPIKLQDRMSGFLYMPFGVKADKWMERHDFPILVNHSFSWFSGLHYLVSTGCNNIYCAGLSLTFWYNGTYDGKGCNPNLQEVIFDRIKQIWDSTVERNLRHLNVDFTSHSLRTARDRQEVPY